MEALPDLSVVVPVLDAAAYLPAFLTALAEQQWTGSWEVVMADNGSTDGSVELIAAERKRLPALQVVHAGGGRGPGQARNAGAREARGQALVFVDADDIPAPGYLAAMGEALREHDLVCSRIEVEELNPRWTTALRGSPQKEGPGAYLSFLPYAGGSSTGIRRSLFERLGGFDSRLGYAEDVDLCWRAQLFAGAELAFVPEAVLHVRQRASLSAMFRQARSWGEAEARLQLSYREYGARVPWRETYHRWRRIVRHLPRLRHKAGRAWWLTQFGNAVGRVEGAARARLRGPDTPMALRSAESSNDRVPARPPS
ncbi:MAG TPA: glycosyltransferase [Thermoleophilaceae bacterium]|jgi:GT2 family glycosyltransferase